MRRSNTGGIRIRLLIYGIGVAVPLTYVGLAGIWAMWNASRLQLDDSLKKQAEITAVAFERWIEAQQEPLTAIAAYLAEQPGPRPDLNPDLNRVLRLAVATRPHWVGLHVIGARGNVLLSNPPDAPPLSAELAENLLAEIERGQWAIDTDWSRGDEGGLMLLAAPIQSGGAVVAQVDIIRMSSIFMGKAAISDQSVFSVFGPQGRLLLYRNPAPEPYLGK
ncbi:MAG TPA: hypothetical protein VNO14_12045, partial [Blastocatellia bacterium]|nr:hypothetical protein [Blastocatellia bacterium]